MKQKRKQKLNSNKQDSLVANLYTERNKLSDAIQDIDKQIEDAEKESRIARLTSYIGKYFKDTEKHGSYSTVYYVVGVSECTTRNRVYEVNENGVGKTAWLTFQEHDCIYDMSEKKQCDKAKFDRIVYKIEQRILNYYVRTGE